jgi:DNA-binding MarR family transcriptional regulator
MAFEGCHCMALRRAARRVSNFYDSVLAPAGLRATQYSILALLSENGAVSINDLAHHLELDRTTTGKNLRPLTVARMVKITRSPTDGRARLAGLTKGGAATLKMARPLWKRAQTEFESSNGKKLARHLRQTLSELTVNA